MRSSWFRRSSSVVRRFSRSSRLGIVLISSRILSAVLSLKPTMLSPGSFVCDECQKMNGSGSYPYAWPKRRIWKLRGRMIDDSRSEIGFPSIDTSIPTAPRFCWITSAARRRSGQSDVVRVREMGVTFSTVFFPSRFVSFFSRIPSPSSSLKPARERADAAASISNVSVSLLVVPVLP